MTVTIQAGSATGTLAAIPSKSAAHRLLICAALADRPTQVTCPQSSQDIAATIRCLTGLGADIQPREDGYQVTPIPRDKPAEACLLDCGESGSTLRFLLPVAGALGAEATFQMAGRLAQRPMGPLTDQLQANGCAIDLKEGEKTLTITGQLQPGTYTLPGDVSSQFISGLLFALPLLGRASKLTVTGQRESASYIRLTLRALAGFGLTPQEEADGWTIPAQSYTSPGLVRVEGDWSNAAPWLCLGALGGESVTVKGMDLDSLQGDRKICQVLSRMGARISCTAGRVTSLPGQRTPTHIDARDIPDLVPVLAAVAAATPGATTITGAARLRLKESDRLETTARTLNALGGQVEETEDGLVIHGKAQLTGGTVDAAGDHRIAMAAAVASGACAGPVTVTGAQAVEKSYPTFWQELRKLGKSVDETPDHP